MKQQPDGFAISFNRYDRTKRWGWKQTKGIIESTVAGHCMQRHGFKSRRLALIDLITEVESRAATSMPTSAAANAQVTATT